MGCARRSAWAPRLSLAPQPCWHGAPDPFARPLPAQTQGGSPWGAGTLAGPDGSRKPTETELEFAQYQGKRIAEVTKKLAA